MSKIKVYIKQPHKVPYVTHISNTLSNLQRTVDGFIETVTLASDLVIICNEFGALGDYDYNCTICGAQMFGTLIFAGVDGDEFGSCKLKPYELHALFPQLWRT